MTGILGYADDAIIVTAVLRSVVRRAGIDAVRAHWPGTDDGFTALARLTGITGPTTTQIDDADRATLGDRGPVDGLGDRGPAEAVAPISASTMIAEVVARLTIEARGEALASRALIDIARAPGVIVNVPVQYYQSVIAMETAVTGVLLFQIRFFESDADVPGNRLLIRGCGC